MWLATAKVSGLPFGGAAALRRAQRYNQNDRGFPPASAAVLLVLGALVSGCANNQALSTGFAGPAQAGDAERDPGKKTMASKVLSAIALERVTGRKPDPARLNELN